MCQIVPDCASEIRASSHEKVALGLRSHLSSITAHGVPWQLFCIEPMCMPVLTDSQCPVSVKESACPVISETSMHHQCTSEKSTHESSVASAGCVSSPADMNSPTIAQTPPKQAHVQDDTVTRTERRPPCSGARKNQSRVMMQKPTLRNSPIRRRMPRANNKPRRRRAQVRRTQK